MRYAVDLDHCAANPLFHAVALTASTRWEKTMLARAEEIDCPDAFPYKVKLHEFRAGRVSIGMQSIVSNRDNALGFEVKTDAVWAEL